MCYVLLVALPTATVLCGRCAGAKVGSDSEAGLARQGSHLVAEEGVASQQGVGTADAAGLPPEEEASVLAAMAGHAAALGLFAPSSAAPSEGGSRGEVPSTAGGEDDEVMPHRAKHAAAVGTLAGSGLGRRESSVGAFKRRGDEEEGAVGAEAPAGHAGAAGRLAWVVTTYAALPHLLPGTCFAAAFGTEMIILCRPPSHQLQALSWIKVLPLRANSLTLFGRA